MVKPKTRAFLIVGGLVVLLIGLLATATMVRTVLAQTATPGATTPSDGDTDIPALPFGRSGRLGGFGHSGSRDGGDEYLAEALGITVEELQAARETAYAAYLADAVAAGEITQAQADELLAQQRLSSYIDHEALVAEALGLSVDELEAALAGGQSLSDLMTAQGLTAETLQTALQTAYEAAIARAVADGVITQAQADAYLSASPNFGLFGGHHGFGGGRGGHGHGGGFSRPDDTDPDTTTPETTDTGFGA
ncbi:MAG: hypothetical protein K1X50_20485 [Candidatus Promineofilum sp.]|nr:hypothetical protein [Promineifilum sp.]